MCVDLIEKFYFSPVLPLKGASEEGSEFSHHVCFTHGGSTQIYWQKNFYVKKKELNSHRIVVVHNVFSMAAVSLF